MFRYVVWNTVSVVALALVEYFFHVFEFVWNGDATHISIVIFATYVSLTACIPFMFRLDLLSQYEWIERIRFITNRFPYLAIIGTAIGMMIIFNIIGKSGISDVTVGLHSLFVGMETVLLTTVFGMAFTMLMDLQLKFEFDISEDGK